MSSQLRIPLLSSSLARLRLLENKSENSEFIKNAWQHVLASSFEGAEETFIDYRTTDYRKCKDKNTFGFLPPIMFRMMISFGLALYLHPLKTLDVTPFPVAIKVSVVLDLRNVHWWVKFAGLITSFPGISRDVISCSVGYNSLMSIGWTSEFRKVT